MVDRDAEATDLFSSSMIFGNATTGVSAIAILCCIRYIAVAY